MHPTKKALTMTDGESSNISLSDPEWFKQTTSLRVSESSNDELNLNPNPNPFDNDIVPPPPNGFRNKSPPPPPPLQPLQPSPPPPAKVILPNKERAQYLQTSHLSEQPDDEPNLDLDLPPPGLSRLIVGEPNTQLVGRLADGEDTSKSSSSTETLADIVTSNVSANTGPYKKRDERNIKPRVVTGLETSSVSTLVDVPTTHTVRKRHTIAVQREKVLDGENLEDALSEPQQQGASSGALNATIGSISVNKDIFTHSKQHHQHQHQRQRRHTTSHEDNERMHMRSDMKHNREENHSRRSNRHYTEEEESRNKKSHRNVRRADKNGNRNYSHSNSELSESPYEDEHSQTTQTRKRNAGHRRDSVPTSKSTQKPKARKSKTSDNRRRTADHYTNNTTDDEQNEQVERKPKRYSNVGRHEEATQKNDTQKRRSDIDEYMRLQHQFPPQPFLYMVPPNYPYGYLVNYGQYGMPSMAPVSAFPPNMAPPSVIKHGAISKYANVPTAVDKNRNSPKMATEKLQEGGTQTEQKFAIPGVINPDLTKPEDKEAINNTEKSRKFQEKSNEIHGLGLISPGIVISLKPKYIPNIGVENNFKILKFNMKYDDSHEHFLTFPGPLLVGRTHKQTVIKYCEEQIRKGPPKQSAVETKKRFQQSDSRIKASYTLLWDFISLLLRQNGHVDGIDIAELLLKSQQKFPYSTFDANTDKKNTDSESNLNKNEMTQEHEHNRHQAKVKPTPNEREITENFRNYLLRGNIDEALDWAAENNLWGHALFLCSNLDRRTHANVMMKFVNKILMNDPLQTLYQLLSGRMPSSVNTVNDAPYGDWRPHLAIIISNAMHKPDLVHKAITSAGDTHMERGDIYAAHFCYLTAQVSFSKYNEKDAKLVLIGSVHKKKFDEFATNKAIIMTEIYQYANSLNNEKFTNPEFLHYKFLLAARMMDYGFTVKALRYMENIAACLLKAPQEYSLEFQKMVYNLGERLKVYEPTLALSCEDMNSLEDRELSWLESLKDIITPKQISSEEDTLVTLHQRSEESVLSKDNEPYSTPLNLSHFNMETMQFQQDQTADLSQINPPKYAISMVSSNTANTVNTEHTEHGTEQNKNVTAIQPVSQTPISMPKRNFYHEENLRIQQQQQQQQQQQYQRQQQQQQQDANLQTNRKPILDGKENADSKSTASTTLQQPRWISSLFNKFLSRNANQMNLPDDTDPIIVWDGARGVWVNREQKEDNMTGGLSEPLLTIAAQNPDERQHYQEDENFEQASVAQQQQQHTTGAVSVATPVSGLNQESNQFKLQRTRTIKHSYVDLFNALPASASTAHNNTFAAHENSKPL